MGIDGKTILIALLTLLAASTLAEAGPPSVRLDDDDNIEYDDGAGHTRLLTYDSDFNKPVLSPNGRMAAFTRDEGPSDLCDPAPTSLWIVDLPDGEPRLLFASRPAKEDDSSEQRIDTDMRSFGNPVFSLDGGFIYLDVSDCSPGGVLHQVNVATGAERLVTRGNFMGVIRNGPYRGNLLMWFHYHYGPPKFGSYDPGYIVRPDGKQLFMIPGSEDSYGTETTKAWMKANGWDYW